MDAMDWSAGDRHTGPRGREPERERRPEKVPTERDYVEARMGWAQRRREKIVAEIERNRRGDHRVPTWLLVLVLVAFVTGWAAVIVLS